ncbi:MAG: tRNA (adenosine(37)-N6)-threonylcarbamoyltransferase complex transferase subunit TsaD [Bacteroidales bacterium]|jgi:N6-L-threonylcarbamoyladenine synthase|nr:tRNA (adenosine(37)-N6)-threonylcarbamoyltransferase complex transferase subunit TsaD [Bacteroidales bacterium]
MSIHILGIESSCDDTSAAVIRDGYMLSNIIASQEVHRQYGGVVPELASRAHQQNIIPVVDAALRQAGIGKKEIDAVAFTRGPGLLGSLLVGTSFAKGFALVTGAKLIEVNHLHAHILSNFIQEEGKEKEFPRFPFLCLLVSGGHTQIIVMRDYLDMEIIGQTIDDAAGEAFDKCAKVMGLPYPGGPVIDRLAKEGNSQAFHFSKPSIKELDYSFSGLKTSFLYTLRDKVKEDPDFIEKNKADLCASLQRTIVEILMHKLEKAIRQTQIKEIAIAGGVAANSGLRNAVAEAARINQWKAYIPEFRFTTDNAAMIAITGYFKYQRKLFASQDIAPTARYEDSLSF